MSLQKNTPDRTDEFSSLKILLVDDDRFQIHLLREMLATLGVPARSVCTARSGLEALRQLETRPMPDLLMCDLHMPGMDGFQFMESVANLGFENSLAIISGQSGQVRYSAGLVANLRLLKYLGALEKPVSPALLEQLLSEAVNCREGKRSPSAQLLMGG